MAPNLGLNISGEKEIDFGNRCFTAILTSESKIELVTEEGKRMKSLPKPNAKDDVEKAEEAKKELAALKERASKCSFHAETTFGNCSITKALLVYTIRGSRYLWKIQL